MVELLQLAAMNGPTSRGSRFTACSSPSTRTDALSKLATAVNRAEKAHTAYMDNDHATAIAQWKLVFNQ